MNETEITRQLTIFEELAKHLATKEELQKLRVELILWIIGTNVAIGLESSQGRGLVNAGKVKHFRMALISGL